MQTIDFAGADPHELWAEWRITLPVRGVQARVRAEDRAADVAGWLAFSEPYLVTKRSLAGFVQATQVLTAACLALSLIWGPGILLGCRRPAGAGQAMVLIGAGPLLLALGGLLVGLVSSASAVMVGRAVTILLWLGIGAGLWRERARLFAPSAAWYLCIAVTLAAVGKASFSRGPENELYRGTLSRTLEVGDRSDARISYHVVQTIAHRLDLPGEEATAYFAPWNFFSRGPWAGLAATPICLATAGMPTREMPDAAWQLFDPHGFAAYRIVLMALAGTVVMALFLALQSFVGPAWALLGAGTLALCPFGFHEIYFTWPKWEATAWLAVSFLAAHERRAMLTGAAIAAGYFYHPLALLWVPWIGRWLLGRQPHAFPSVAKAALGFAGVLAVLVGPWMLLGRGQDGFLHYLLETAHLPSTFGWWFVARFRSFVNTFMPLHLGLVDTLNWGTNSVYGEARTVERFAFGWWNTLPMGMGLGLWLVSMRALLPSGLDLRRWVGVFVIGPAVLLTVYWGVNSSGILRECGHPLLVASVAGACMFAQRDRRGKIATLYRHPLFPWLLLPATRLMTWLTTLSNDHSIAVVGSEGWDVFWLGLNLAGLATAAWIVSRYGSAEALARDHADVPAGYFTEEG